MAETVTEPRGIQMTADLWSPLPPTHSLALTPTFASTHYLSFTESGIDNLAVSNIDPRRLESVMTCSTVVTAFKNNNFLCLFVLENMIALQLQEFKITATAQTRRFHHSKVDHTTTMQLLKGNKYYKFVCQYSFSVYFIRHNSLLISFERCIYRPGGRLTFPCFYVILIGIIDVQLH